MWRWGVVAALGSQQSRSWGLPVWQHLSPCTGAPTVSIFQKPPGVIPPGGSTTICCICQRSYGSFVLYKGSRRLHTLEQSGSRAEFSISNATYKDKGTYICHYLEEGTVLARSDELEVSVEGPRAHQDAHGHSMMGRVFLFFPGLERWGPFSPLPEPVGGFTEILVLLAHHQSPLHLLIPSPVPTELRLPRPDLSVLPGHEVTAGADVMFRCTSAPPSTACYLYLEGQTRAQLLSREQGDYNLSHVQQGDSGRYSCQCYTMMNASREWSASEDLSLHLPAPGTVICLVTVSPSQWHLRASSMFPPSFPSLLPLGGVTGRGCPRRQGCGRCSWGPPRGSLCSLYISLRVSVAQDLSGVSPCLVCPLGSLPCPHGRTGNSRWVLPSDGPFCPCRLHAVQHRAPGAGGGAEPPAPRRQRCPAGHRRGTAAVIPLQQPALG
uniref:Ig-like domain-containing protein n=1 Tax=Cyanoderma ruficeps TaxID=181631 RepID=A0A8C3XGF5_9PASS